MKCSTCKAGVEFDPNKPIEVTRYANRKLYLHEGSRYINLTEVEGLIKRGFEVKVVSHPDGKDLTNEILAGILNLKYKKAVERLASDELLQRVKSI